MSTPAERIVEKLTETELKLKEEKLRREVETRELIARANELSRNGQTGPTS